jgi:phosphoribosylaminoimidazole-succinocarboxamide synthase
MSQTAPMGRFIRSGKVKDIYDLGDDLLLFHFTDRVSAFDVVLPSLIPHKGTVLCNLTAYWFETLGVAHHMIRLEGPNMMVVKKLSMIPVECVVRGYLYGSLFERAMLGEVSLPVDKVQAAKLPEPIFDPTTKSDVKDVFISETQIVREGRMTEAELSVVKRSTIAIYEKMSKAAQEAGFILADLKLEFGRDENRTIVLGDSIGPDEFRLWPASEYKPGRPQASYDKQPIRDWLSAVGYRTKLEASRKQGLKVPSPPPLPPELVAETSKRYVEAYERLTRRKLEVG